MNHAITMCGLPVPLASLSRFPTKETWWSLATPGAVYRKTGNCLRSRRGYVEQLRKDLDAHGQEALAVAKAAQVAADDMQQVKKDLAQLEADAVGAGFEIDRVSSTVQPGPTMQGDMVEMLAKEAGESPLVSPSGS